jgi:RNA polymerase sigma-70 factor (ECF subfamily)
VRERLFVSEPGVRPRIAEYSGRGSLINFVRVVAARLRISKARKRGEILTIDGSGAAESPSPGSDPELEFIKERYRGEFKRALESALRALDDEARNLLKLHFVDGLTLDQLASLFSVHRATVARRIAAAREEILAGARRLLGERLDADTRELDSLIELVRSRIDLSLPSFFRGRAT